MSDELRIIDVGQPQVHHRGELASFSVTLNRWPTEAERASLTRDGAPGIRCAEPADGGGEPRLDITNAHLDQLSEAAVRVRDAVAVANADAELTDTLGYDYANETREELRGFFELD